MYQLHCRNAFTQCESEVFAERLYLEDLAFLEVTVRHVLYFSLRFEQGYCYFGAKCTFAHGREELEGWRELYERQVENLAQLQEKRLLTQSFSEKVRQRIQSEGRGVVSKIAFI